MKRMRGKKWLALLAVALMLLGIVAVQAEPAHIHVWSDWIVDKAPTCTEMGSRHHICSAEGCPQPDRREDQTLAQLGHDWGDWLPATAATCFAPGTEKRTCKRCQSQETRETKKLEHAWGEWVPTTKPTCFATGVDIRTCSRCQTQEQRVSEQLKHQWGAWTVTTKPTSTTTGIEIRTCSLCQTQEQRVVNATGHNWGGWTVTKAATCTDAGSRTRTCLTDKTHVETEVIPATGHNWDVWKPVKAPDCTHAGTEKRICKTDPKHVEERVVAALGHKPSGNWEVVQEPSLNEKGKRVQKCTVCGAVVKTQTFAPAGYTYGLRAWAYGPLGGQVNPALSGTTARVVYIDMAQEGTFRYPLVTEDGWNIGTIEVVVAGGTIRVKMDKASEPTVLKYRYWHQFPDAASVNSAKLMADYGESLPFEMPVKVEGESCLIVVRTDANYYKGRQNQQFSDLLMNLNGTGSYADEVQAALVALGIAEQ
jgi:hypothetical protein